MVMQGLMVITKKINLLLMADSIIAPFDITQKYRAAEFVKMVTKRESNNKKRDGSI